MSKEMVVTASRLSSVPKPVRDAIEVSRLTRAACGIATPFGRPVEPDV